MIRNGSGASGTRGAYTLAAVSNRSERPFGERFGKPFGKPFGMPFVKPFAHCHLWDAREDHFIENSADLGDTAVQAQQQSRGQPIYTPLTRAVIHVVIVPFTRFRMGPDKDIGFGRSRRRKLVDSRAVRYVQTASSLLPLRE